MKKKRLILILIATIATSATARWWLPALLQMLSVNGELIQSLDSLISIVSNAVTLISALGGYLLIRADKKETETLDQRNRRIMLDHVENFWVKGILEKSLYGAALLELGIKEEPDAVKIYPWGIKRESTDKILPSGMPMLEIFKQIGNGRSLLILGAPGSGKTTMLLDLARQLVDRARQDETEPIPVVFNLASWTEKQSLEEWLAIELNTIYSVPKKTAPNWVAANKMLLLIDGLDEVRKNYRLQCIDAINQFLKEHGLISLVVCSRTQDYFDLNSRLAIGGAIEIQPLTQKQVKAYFQRFGKRLAGIRQVIIRDTALKGMAETPLFLSIMALAYQDKQAEEILISENVDTQHKYVFDIYIERMFERPGRSRSEKFSKGETLQWLSWLARKVIQYNQVPFLIENIQIEWLNEGESDKESFSFAKLGTISGIVSGLFSGLIAIPVAILSSSWGFWDILLFTFFGIFHYGDEFLIQIANPDLRSIFIVFIIKLLKGLIFGLIAGITIGFSIVRNKRISTINTLTWSWREARWGLYLGLAAGLVVALFIFGLSAGLTVGLIVGLSVGLSDGLSVGNVGETNAPNQGIKQSAKNALLMFFSFGLIGWLVLGLPNVLYAAGLELNPITRTFSEPMFVLAIGLFGWLRYGGIATLQHFILRFLLSKANYFPSPYWRLVPFLDYCTELIFLRRVGGGYIFVHRLLMEHFAEMDEETINRLAGIGNEKQAVVE